MLSNFDDSKQNSTDPIWVYLGSDTRESSLHMCIIRSFGMIATDIVS